MEPEFETENAPGTDRRVELAAASAVVLLLFLRTPGWNIPEIA
jgi:hypothetical protein